MTHKIYWFSGTGNSLFVARRFASMFQNVELVSIARLGRGEDVVFDSDLTGIVFPVYCSGIPKIVSNFLARVMPGENKGEKYIYTICTSGGFPGAALPLVEDTLAEKGLNLNAAFHIRMPSGYIPLSGPPGEKQIAALFKNAERAVRIAAIAVKRRRRTRPLRVFPIDMFIKFVAKKAVETLHDSDRFFKTNDSCDGCGLCSRVCPASNISLDANERPVWHHSCEQCMACLQWCPENAIEYGSTASKRAHYHHPEVTAEDICRVPPDEN